MISPWKRAGPFIWTNLFPIYLRMLCAKFGWNWPSGSGEEDENVKSLRQQQQRRQRPRRRQRRRTADKFWSKKLMRAFGSGELKSLFLGKLGRKLMRYKNQESVWFRNSRGGARLSDNGWFSIEYNKKNKRKNLFQLCVNEVTTYRRSGIRNATSIDICCSK